MTGPATGESRPSLSTSRRRGGHLAAFLLAATLGSSLAHAAPRLRGPTRILPEARTDLPLRSVVLSPDGGSALLVRDESIELWDVDLQRRVWIQDATGTTGFRGTSNRYVGAAFLPDAEGVLAARADMPMWILHRATGLWSKDVTVPSFRRGYRAQSRTSFGGFRPGRSPRDHESISAISASRTGGVVVTRSRHPLVYRAHSTRGLRYPFGASPKLDFSSRHLVSPGGSWILETPRARTGAVRRLSTRGAEALDLDVGRASGSVYLAVSADDARFAARWLGGPLRIYDAQTGAVLRRLDRPGGLGGPLAFHEGGGWVFEAEPRKALRVYPVQAPRRSRRRAGSSQGGPLPAGLVELLASPRGDALIGFDGEGRLWRWTVDAS